MNLFIRQLTGVRFIAAAWDIDNKGVASWNS